MSGIMGGKVFFMAKIQEKKLCSAILPDRKKLAFSEIPPDAKVETFMWSICEDCWKTDPRLKPSMNDIERQIR